MKKYLFLSCLFCVIQMALAQTGGTLKGKLTDENNNNEPVAFANVAVYKMDAKNFTVDSDLLDGSSTDENGEYYIPNLPEGLYMVEITYIDFPRSVKVFNVLLASNRTTLLDYKYPKYDNFDDEKRLEPIEFLAYSNYYSTNRTNKSNQGTFSVSAKIVHR